MSQDRTEALRDKIVTAVEQQQPLNIQGSGSKAFLGRYAEGTTLDVSAHCGIISYETKELVLTARAGTPLKEIEQTLAEQGQMLGFEPPHFGDNATLGGTIACGLSGPRRPFAGSARDFVLGTRVINGRGEILRFGGEVMKNVAGYDLSRLMTGAMGTLGLLLEVSIKVLPRPEHEMTLVKPMSQAEALAQMVELRRTPNPISAAGFVDGILYLRLSGAESTVNVYADKIGGEVLGKADSFWQQWREQQPEFFAGERPLWRLSLPATAPMPDLNGDWLIDWGGSLRWMRSDDSSEKIFATTSKLGGHAQCFRGPDREQPYQPLPSALLKFHQQLKASFDPAGIFNPGRMYANV